MASYYLIDALSTFVRGLVLGLRAALLSLESESPRQAIDRNSRATGVDHTGVRGLVSQGLISRSRFETLIEERRARTAARIPSPRASRYTPGGRGLVLRLSISYPGSITIARAAGTVTYPARFMLVASMNPCPCGYRGSRANDCRCDDATVAKYVAKLSGPLLDRIDLHVTVARVSFDEMVGSADVESSETVRRRVEAARKTQRVRLERYGVSCNAEIAAADVRAVCVLDDGSMELLHAAMTRGSVSARAFDRIARVARTIADLHGAADIRRAHVAEALLYRSIDRNPAVRV
jgi:hypothetical protein